MICNCANRLSFLLHLCLYSGSHGAHRGVPELRLAHDDHPLAGKGEVCGPATNVDLANKLTRRVPNVDAIAASGVDVTLGVTVNTCRLLSTR